MNQNELIKHVRFQMFIYILVIICFLLSLFAILTTPVKAKEQTTDITSQIFPGQIFGQGCSSTTTNRYCMFQSNGSSYIRNFATTYTGVGDYMSIGISYYFNLYTTYNIFTIYANSNDFRNNDLSVNCYSYQSSPSQANEVACSVVFVSKSQLKVYFPYDTLQKHEIIIGGQHLTGDTNYNIKKVTLTYNDGQGDNTDVIEAAAKNALDIMNNASSNTEEIVDSQEQINNTLTSMMNSQNLIASDDLQTSRTQLESMCSNSYSVSLTKGGLISGNSVTNNNLGFYSDYINVSLRGNTFSRVCLTNTYQGNTPNQYLIFYDSNKNVLQTNYANNVCRNLPSGTAYFRIGTLYPGALITAGDYCQKAEDQINAYLRDDSNPSINQSDIEGVISDVQINNPVSYLLTLPVNLVNKINQVFTSGTCSSVNLGHFGFAPDYDFVLPCINFQNYLGSTIWNLVDTIVAAGFIALTFYKIYKSVTNILSLGAEDEISYHLGYLTPMEFLAQIIGTGSWTGGRHNV